MARTRKIPSSFRTAGKLLRFNRRYYARRGQPLPATMNFNSSAQAVFFMREAVKAGRFPARILVVRDLEFLKHHSSPPG